MANVKFEKGDFITWINKPNCFGIFEGIDLTPSYQYSKKYSLALFFDPNKYAQNDNGTYDNKPNLDISVGERRCEKTIDTDSEDYWWHKLTPIQYENAIATLEEWGYRWDEKTLSLIEIETGEIIKQIVIPKIEYNGEVVKPICEDFKTKLVDFVKEKNKPTTYYGSGMVCSSYPYWSRSELEDWD